MADAVIVQDMGKFARGFDHGKGGAVKAEVAFDQRQRAAADGAEADHHKRAVNAGVDGVGHGVAFQCLVVLAAIQSINASKTPEMTKVRWMMTIHFKVSLVTA